MNASNSLIFSLVFLLAGLFIYLLSKKSYSARWLLIVLSLGVSVRYLVWRFQYTLNLSDFPSALISLLVYGAEIYGFFATIFIYIQIWSPKKKVRIAPKRTSEPTVDIFVTIYNEPIDILYRTLVGCKAIAYPEEKKNIFVLDDGQRPEVRALAEQFSCQYIARPNNEHAKAGNLNNGLKFSTGDLVLNFDSDHIPVSSFLEECLGFFEDDKVAFVQTPHHFYNPDPYQRNLKLENEIIHEQNLFFQVIQPGRDLNNSSFYCGSGAIFRRTALEAVGGFTTKSVTEDIHTSIRIHGKGYRSIYYGKKLSAGLSPESFWSYLRQRQRWAKGHAQIFLSRENPFIFPGLSIAQRINYFASIYYFFLGIPRTIFLIAPLFYLLFGIPPIVSDFYVLIHYFLSHYIIALLSFQIVSDRFRNPFWSDVYETVMSFYLSLTALATIFLPKKLSFYVTPKGQKFSKATHNFSAVFPQWTMGVLLIIGLIRGFYLTWIGQVNPEAFSISLYWSLYNLLLITAAIITSREQPQRRNKPRLIRKIPCKILPPQGSSIETFTRDICETGVSLLLEHPAYLPSDLKVHLQDESGESVLLSGKVVRYEKNKEGKSSVAIFFPNIDDAEHQTLIRFMYSAPNSWEDDKQDTNISGFKSFFLLLTVWKAFAAEKISRRITLRRTVRRHCEFLFNENKILGITQDVGLYGALVKIANGKGILKLPKTFSFKIYWDQENFIVLPGDIAWQKPLDSDSSLVGVRFSQLEGDDLYYLRRRLYG